VWEAESSSTARCQLSITLVLGLERGEAEREAAARRPDYIQLASHGDARPRPLALPLLEHRQADKTCSCLCAGDGVLVVQGIPESPHLDIDPLLGPCCRKKRHWRRESSRQASKALWPSQDFISLNKCLGQPIAKFVKCQR
jgi:hypothetical protein